MYAEGIEYYGISSYYDNFDHSEAVNSNELMSFAEPATPYSLENISPPPETDPVTCNCSDIELSPVAEEILAMEESSQGMAVILDRLGYGTAADLLRDAMAAEGAEREMLSAQSVEAFANIYDQLLLLEAEYGFIPLLNERITLLKEELRVQVHLLGEELGPDAQTITAEIQDNFDRSENYTPAPEIVANEPEVCYTSSGLEFAFIPQPEMPLEEADARPVHIDKPEADEPDQEEQQQVVSSSPDLLPPSSAGNSTESEYAIAESASDSPDSPWGTGEFQQGLNQMLNDFYDRVSDNIARYFRESQPGEVLRDEV